MMQRLYLFVFFASLVMVGCVAIPKSELKTVQATPEALAERLVKAYKMRDFEAFSQLAPSYKELTSLIGAVERPANAATPQLDRSQFKAELLGSFLATVDSSCLKVEQIKLLSLRPSGGAIHPAQGYEILPMNLDLQNGPYKARQQITLLHLPDGTYRLGDCLGVQSIEEGL